MNTIDLPTRLHQYAYLIEEDPLWSQDLHEAADALDAAHADRMDAARYRWLKRNNDTRFVLWDRKSHDLNLSPGPVLTLDKVIDEQMNVEESW